MPPPAPDLLVGKEINGKYRVVDVLATGGMGRVYRAEQIPLGRMVALKVLLPNLTEDAAGSDGARAFRARFVREASVLAKLQNPYIVTLFDYGRIESPQGDRERYFMAMELLEGETLQNRLDTSGALPMAKARSFLQQLAHGLRAAHAHGVVHRDLKPSNVMIVEGLEGEQVKLLDFGVTKVMDDTGEATEEGILIGSPRYMAPEQVAGDPVDARTDIYALGVLSFLMLSGVPPFQRDTAVATMMAHLNQPFPSEKLPVGISLPLRKIVERCMQKAPVDRFQTIDELLSALRDGGDVDSSGALAVDGVNPQTTAVRRTSKPFAATQGRRRWTTVLGAAVVLASCATAILLLRTGRESAPREAPPAPAALAPSPTTAPTVPIAPIAPTAPIAPSVAASEPPPATSIELPGSPLPSTPSAAPAGARVSTVSSAHGRAIDKHASSPTRPAASAATSVSLPAAAAPAAPAAPSAAPSAPAKKVDPFGERL